MIELLLQAERSLTVGQLDAAERLYWQAIENDPRNSIAAVGLARVALDRGDDRTAYQLARSALAIDSENPAAQRLVSRLGEVMQHRGEQPPTEPPPVLKRPPNSVGGRRVEGTGPLDPGTAPVAAAASAGQAVAAGSEPARGSAPGTEVAAGSDSTAPKVLPKRRGLIGRILGR